MADEVKGRASSKVMLWLGSLACAALLGGCASQPSVRDYVAPSAACCSSISEFQFRPMTLGQEVEFSLTADGPSYAFEGRRQHFIALKIPDGFTATMIQVNTFLSTSFLPSATAVIPEFIYLRTDFKIVERQTTGGFQQAGGFWRTTVSGRAVAPPDARYIVVVANDGSNGLPTYHAANGRPYSIPAAALGDFTLRLFGESVNK